MTKPKFEVLNRVERGVRGNTVTSRTRAQEVRTATILPQLREKSRAHTSNFVDRRFGERDREMSREDKMQERFTREQQRLSRRNGRRGRFDLNEPEDAASSSLTHGGRSLAQMDDDELEDYDARNDDDSGDEMLAGGMRRVGGQLERDFVSSGHFGGFQEEGDEAGAKSKQDVMREMIAKSKFHKLERQRIKEENDAICDDLNSAFSEIRQSLHVLQDEDRRRMRAGGDDYESMLNDLVFDPRSRPTDRTLEPEERQWREEQKTKARERALQERMLPEEDRRRDASSASGVEDLDGSARGRRDAEPEDEGELPPVVDLGLKRIAHRQFVLMRRFCRAEDETGAQEAYAPLVVFARSQPRTMIQLARAIRTDLAVLATSFTDRSNATGRGALMPAAAPTRLLLLVSRLFSCSDFHHLVATPAQLLLVYYLAVGRMTRLAHVQRALALVYLATEFQATSKRCVPEALEILFSLLRVARGADALAVDDASHYFCRPIGQSLAKQLRAVGLETLTASPLAWSQLFFAKCDCPAQLLATAQTLTHRILLQLEAGAYPALREAARPFHLLLPADPTLTAILSGSGASQPGLQLQSHRPVPLPQLTPDYSVDYSLDSRRKRGPDAEDADARTTKRLRAAYRREFRGAVRELKRDAAFLADHKVRERREKDAAYRTRINQVVGSIGNENSGGSTKQRRK